MSVINVSILKTNYALHVYSELDHGWYISHVIWMPECVLAISYFVSVLYTVMLSILYIKYSLLMQRSHFVFYGTQARSWIFWLMPWCNLNVFWVRGSLCFKHCLMPQRGSRNSGIYCSLSEFISRFCYHWCCWIYIQQIDGISLRISGSVIVWTTMSAKNTYLLLNISTWIR